MLVLTRKHGETIRIGNDIVVKVIQLGKGSVKIGIEAPSHVRVLRGELREFEGPRLAESVAVDAEDDEELDVDRFLEQFSEMFDLSVITDLSQGQPVLSISR